MRVPPTLYTPRVPHGFGEGRMRRLFADSRAEEEGTRGLMGAGFWRYGLAGST